MAEYVHLEDEIKAYKRYRIGNYIMAPVSAVCASVFTLIGVNNFSEGKNMWSAFSTAAALYMGYKTWEFLKANKYLNKRIAELHEEKRMSLEKKLEQGGE
ncbi:MAG: hypothetical protein V1734_05915 [Nanoarchaeota archaeon]